MDRQQQQQGEQGATLHVRRGGGDALTLQAGRQLRWPLGALRTLLEGRRGAGMPDAERAFTERAISELVRAERAASDLIRWSAPRELRPSRCKLSQLAFSLSSALDREDRRRCRFVIEDGDAALNTDGQLLVDGIARVIELALDALGDTDEELMVHTHADTQWATVNLINAGACDRVQPAQHVAESILQRDLTDLGGRVSLRNSGDHRCVVVSIPLGDRGRTLSMRSARPRMDRIGGAA